MGILGSELLIGPRCYLDSIRKADIETSAHWMSNLDITAMLWTARLYPNSLEDEERWFENYHQQQDSKSFSFTIRLNNNDRLIGMVGLNRYDARNRSAWLSVVIGEEVHQSKGYGTESIHLVLRYGFYELNLNRIGLTVSDFNPRAIRAYEKVGFRHEGIKKEALYRDGRYHGVVVMGILNKEWQDPLPVIDSKEA